MADSVTIRIQGFEELRRNLNPRHATNAMRSALNRSVRKLRTQSGKDARREQGIKSAQLKKRVRQKNARGRDLKASIEFSGSPIGLDSFTRPPRTFVYGPLIQHGGGRRRGHNAPLPARFRSRLPRSWWYRSGNKLVVLQRMARAGYPIRLVFGPSAAAMVSPHTRRYLEQASRDVAEIFEREYAARVAGHVGPR